MTNLKIRNLSNKSLVDFRKMADLELCGTKSKNWAPLEGEIIWQARTTGEELVQGRVYPVWFLGPHGDGDFDNWENPLYRRIRLADALPLAGFQRDCLVDRFPGKLMEPPYRILLLHCSKCDNYAIIDGNHRLARLAHGQLPGGIKAELLLTVRTGSKWDPETPDISKICECISPNH